MGGWKNGWMCAVEAWLCAPVMAAEAEISYCESSSEGEEDAEHEGDEDEEVWVGHSWLCSRL